MSYSRSAILGLFLIFCLSSSANSQSVYKTPSGEKYHLATCHMVKNVSEEISIARAIEIGLQPCKICKPPSVQSGPLPVTRPAGQSETVQCKGITKAGARCKHMTRLANGYCFQHTP